MLYTVLQRIQSPAIPLHLHNRHVFPYRMIVVWTFLPFLTRLMGFPELSLCLFHTEPLSFPNISFLDLGFETALAIILSRISEETLVTRKTVKSGEISDVVAATDIIAIPVNAVFFWPNFRRYKSWWNLKKSGTYKKRRKNETGKCWTYTICGGYIE